MSSPPKSRRHEPRVAAKQGFMRVLSMFGLFKKKPPTTLMDALKPQPSEARERPMKNQKAERKTQNLNSPHDYTQAGNVLGRIFFEPDIWHEMSRLCENKLVAREMAYARVAIIRDAISRLQPHSVATQLLAGVNQYVAVAFAKREHATTATLAIRVYEQNVSPLTRLADVIVRRGLNFGVPAVEIAALLGKVAAEAEALMKFFSASMKLSSRMEKFSAQPDVKSHSPSPEVEAIFKKLDRLMDEEKAQIEGLPEPFRSEVLRGADCDEIAGAAGEFGRDPRNPIPVNGPLGEMIYLSNLRTTSSQQIMFHRLGSVRNVDAFETVSVDGAMWDVLFLDLYHPRKSRRAPTGYRIAADAERERLLFGANECVASFPDQLPDAIANTYERLLGLRMRPPLVREAVERINFRRPNDHLERLNFFIAILHAKATS